MLECVGPQSLGPSCISPSGGHTCKITLSEGCKKVMFGVQLHGRNTNTVLMILLCLFHMERKRVCYCSWGRVGGEGA
ncbi:hypothetical protein SLE2022_050580 [Rubroshorea leprosula]